MDSTRVLTGIDGFDEVLLGGLIPEQAYMLKGGPGTGKTTLGMHFLETGAVRKEKSLFISLGESETQIRRNAGRIGLDLQGITILDLSPSPEFFTEAQAYDIFSPADVEAAPITQKIIEQIEALQPQRVFVDSITQLRYLSTDGFQFHKQVLSFIRFLTGQNATVLFTSEGTIQAPDDDLQFLSDGVIHLKSYDDIRFVEVTKFRGSSFQRGAHVLRLTESGMIVFPKLKPSSLKQEFDQELLSSGIPELDELLHGGIERGTVTVVTGPTGVGKTTFAMQFMKEAAGRGERSVVYTFEENRKMLLQRCGSINIPIQSMLKQDTLDLVEVEALSLTADELAQQIRKEVEKKHARIVMIDSISSYRLSIRGTDLIEHIHALCKYLTNMGVMVILINEIEAITGEFKATENGISYLADNIIFLRHLEIQGQLRKAIGVLKKRLSSFENTMREFHITRYGVKVGDPLINLRCILSGTPEWSKPHSKAD